MEKNDQPQPSLSSYVSAIPLALCIYYLHFLSQICNERNITPIFYVNKWSLEIFSSSAQGYI